MATSSDAGSRDGLGSATPPSSAPDREATDPRICDEEPTSLADILSEIRDLMDNFDGVPWPQMDLFFYMHGYDELRLALDRILDAISREHPDD
ncbi:hypothetical protein [Glutamicibacter protophormiae]|uniref:hypothetical protein n=1 Tax=Glutamicibacter protophormiae TaxID=37930 RepID=UPI003A90E99B